jgi:hypothetical protein
MLPPFAEPTISTVLEAGEATATVTEVFDAANPIDAVETEPIKDA